MSDLFPAPRQLEMTGSTFALTNGELILLDSAAPQALHFAAVRFQKALFDHLGLTWEVVASKSTPR
jgi:hypothetical protein